ncbi:MAG: deoxyribonuclease IV [Bacilli bacterium]|nr:deoxyribonuclease IV [Bacilli bacterium]MDD4608223.1 deoxyribonuclease IV [Bacilli bacterium]
MKELIIGSHVSFKKDEQLLGSVKEALSYGANTLMLYTGAPQNTNRTEINKDLTLEAHQLMKQNNIDTSTLVVHAPYIINPANTANLDFAISFLKQEISRVEELGLSKIVLHPGSHVGLGKEQAIVNIIRVLNETINPEGNVIICIETMAGKGTEVGSKFEEIKKIIDGIKVKDKIGVCLDTCHINDAGYDITDFDKVLDEFDKVIGLKYLKCLHINDSKNAIGAHKDRHDNFGYGTLGFDNLINIIYNPKIKDIPKILETPFVSIDDNSKERMFPPYKFEIEMIKDKVFNDNLIEDIRTYYK